MVLTMPKRSLRQTSPSENNDEPPKSSRQALPEESPVPADSGPIEATEQQLDLQRTSAKVRGGQPQRESSDVSPVLPSETPLAAGKALNPRETIAPPLEPTILRQDFQPIPEQATHPIQHDTATGPRLVPDQPPTQRPTQRSSTSGQSGRQLDRSPDGQGSAAYIVVAILQYYEFGREEPITRCIGAYLEPREAENAIRDLLKQPDYDRRAATLTATKDAAFGLPADRPIIKQLSKSELKDVRNEIHAYIHITSITGGRNGEIVR